MVFEPIGALAHLGLARAHAMVGDTAEAKAAYQHFLTLWKDYDPDVPIFKQAKAEYAKMLRSWNDGQCEAVDLCRNQAVAPIENCRPGRVKAHANELGKYLQPPTQVLF